MIMLIIPLPWSREDLEILRNEHDVFDLIMTNSTQQFYLIIEDDTITWVGQGTVSGKVSYQIKSRTIELGEGEEKPVLIGNVGFGGNFDSVEDYISKHFPLNGYCIENMRFSNYSGQRIRGNKDHYAVIEPIICLLSNSPSNRLRHFLQTLGWGERKKIECSGTWENNLKLLIDDKVYPTIESWLIKFYEIALPNKILDNTFQGTQNQKTENTSFKDGLIGAIGIIMIILILKSCFAG